LRKERRNALTPSRAPALRFPQQPPGSFLFWCQTLAATSAKRCLLGRAEFSAHISIWIGRGRCLAQTGVPTGATPALLDALTCVARASTGAGPDPRERAITPSAKDM
jgi:hypothetical protein